MNGSPGTAWRAFRTSQRLRVAHLPRNLGGNASILSRQLANTGITSISISFDGDPFGFEADMTVCRPGDSLFVKEIRRLAWMVRVLRSADVLHFNAGTTLAMPSDDSVRMPGRTAIPWRILRRIHARYSDWLQVVELRVAQVLGKTMFMTFQGDDLRQGGRSLELFEDSIAHHVGRDYYNQRSDAAKRRRLERYRSRGVRFYFLNPDLGWFLDGEGRFLPYSNVPHAPVPPPRHRDPRAPVRIVHAPSHRAAKGTDAITRAVDTLRSEGWNFHFDLVEHVPNKQALRMIGSADLLIDQLHAGWYGGVAVEAMSRGVAVMAYIRDEDLTFIPAEMASEIPVLRIDHLVVADAIRSYLGLSEDERRAISEASAAYVARWHDPARIAAQLADDYHL